MAYDKDARIKVSVEGIAQARKEIAELNKQVKVLNEEPIDTSESTENLSKLEKVLTGLRDKLKGTKPELYDPFSGRVKALKEEQKLIKQTADQRILELREVARSIGYRKIQENAANYEALRLVEIEKKKLEELRRSYNELTNNIGHMKKALTEAKDVATSKTFFTTKGGLYGPPQLVDYGKQDLEGTQRKLRELVTLYKEIDELKRTPFSLREMARGFYPLSKEDKFARESERGKRREELKFKREQAEALSRQLKLLPEGYVELVNEINQYEDKIQESSTISLAEMQDEISNREGVLAARKRDVKSSEELIKKSNDELSIINMIIAALKDERAAQNAKYNEAIAATELQRRVREDYGSAMGKIGSDSDRADRKIILFLRRWRWNLSMIMVSLNALRTLAGASQVVAASTTALGQALGYIIDSILVAYLDDILWLIGLLIGIGDWINRLPTREEEEERREKEGEESLSTGLEHWFRVLLKQEPFLYEDFAKLVPVIAAIALVSFSAIVAAWLAFVGWLKEKITKLVDDIWKKLFPPKGGAGTTAPGPEGAEVPLPIPAPYEEGEPGYAETPTGVPVTVPPPAGFFEPIVIATGSLLKGIIEPITEPISNLAYFVTGKEKPEYEELGAKETLIAAIEGAVAGTAVSIGGAVVGPAIAALLPSILGGGAPAGGATFGASLLGVGGLFNYITGQEDLQDVSDETKRALIGDSDKIDAELMEMFKDITWGSDNAADSFEDLGLTRIDTSNITSFDEIVSLVTGTVIGNMTALDGTIGGLGVNGTVGSWNTSLQTFLNLANKINETTINPPTPTAPAPTEKEETFQDYINKLAGPTLGTSTPVPLTGGKTDLTGTVKTTIPSGEFQGTTIYKSTEPSPGKTVSYVWDSVLKAYVPKLQEGGIIERTGIAMVHKGETVVPAGKSNGGNTIVIQNAKFEVKEVQKKEIIQAVLAELKSGSRRAIHG